MIFNGTSFPYLKVLMGFARPVISNIEFDVMPNKKAGGRIRKKRLNPLILQVPVQIKNIGNKTLEQIKEELTNWLYFNEDKKLEFKDTPNRYYMAQFYEIDLEERYRYAKGTISFICQEPFRFGPNNNLNITSTFTPFTIKGQYEAIWKLSTRFTANTTDYTLENNVGGKLVLKYTFKANDLLEVDFKTRKITLNGVVIQTAIQFESNWGKLVLVPGVMQFKATQNTTITYTEHYF